MKGVKLGLAIGAVALMSACSTMTEVETRTSYAMPKWYEKCQEAGTDGWFWWKEDYVYSCGAGVSVHHQAAEEEMKAFALNALAQRIHGTIDSETVVKFNNQKKSSTTVIKHIVPNTAISEYVQYETAWYELNGQHYKFVRVKMKKETFDTLKTQAQLKSNG